VHLNLGNDIMESFTPISSALGGALIGLAAALMLFGLGRIAGISGIFGGLVLPKLGDISHPTCSRSASNVRC